MSTVAADTKRAVKELLDPAIDVIENGVREARRTAEAARRTLEDGAADATRTVRRHPVAAVTVAAGLGVLLGCAIGFAAGRQARSGCCQ
jgi:ElaB/YqjD/DUF883 family membrane-anchored ribosome-binding protein